MRINEIEPTKSPTVKQLFNKHFNKEGKITIDSNGLVSCDGSVELKDNMMVNKLPVKFLHVDGTFQCSNHNLTSLEGCPQTVGGSFYCSRNQLTSLNGCAQIIGKSFSCTNNNLTSLEGGPKSVGEIYNCFMNPLATLKGLPDQISGMLSLTYTPQLPLMRTLVAKEIEFYMNDDLVAREIVKILNKYAGQGKSAMMKCSSEILTLGKELGVDLRQNARW